MKKYIAIVSILIPTALFAGCSTYWYQEGKSFDECKQARTECRAELLKRSDLSGLTVDYEVKFIENCMGQKGYRLVTAEDLPLDMRREEPDTTFHWRTVGVAGTIEE